MDNWLLFDFSQDVNENLKISDDKNSVQVSAVDIFAYAIKAIKDHFEGDLNGRNISFKTEKVLHIVTVPAIWSESAKDLMEKAAIKVHT